MPDEADQTTKKVVDLREIAQAANRRLAWSGASEELQVNLLVLAAGETIAEHVNAEVDVLLVGIDGEGTVEIDVDRQTLGAGQALIVPKGAHRSIAGASERFAYLSCHRRRGGLRPTRRP